MPRLPRIAADELLRALKRDGWAEVRRRGSHVVLDHPTKPGIVVVPVHAGKVLAIGTLNAILDQAGLSVDDLRRLL
jgi:predicted RNA binding protein YcfA (HicA-like mRNA interferase family)